MSHSVFTSTEIRLLAPRLMLPLAVCVVAALSVHHAAGLDTGMPKGPPTAVDLTVYRTESVMSVTYHYTLRNRSQEELHNFMIGQTLSSDSCPELQELPIGSPSEWQCDSTFQMGWRDWNKPHAKSIVTAKPWLGCVNFEEECSGHFIEFSYPEGFHGLPSGDSLSFSIELAKGDPTYEHTNFWIVSGYHEYEGRARRTSVGPATGVIAGRVTDENGVPLQYGDVAVKDLGSDYVRVQGKSFVASTDVDGKYVILNVPVGTFTVRAKVLGYVRQDRDSVQVSESDTTIVNFRLQEAVRHIEHPDVVH